MISPATPRMMLRRKIGRQDSPNTSALMRNPARTGPATLEMPPTGPNIPTRSNDEIASAMIAAFHTLVMWR